MAAIEFSSNRGLLLIISSPSGAGKTTLARQLMAEFPDIQFSVSYTTRKRRGAERDGVDYHFVSEQLFERMIANGEFAEHAMVHGNRYGTGKKAVDQVLDQCRDVIFDIDWQGGRALCERWPKDAVDIFVVPPDLATLEARLRGRKTDSDQEIQRRLAMAVDEMRHHDEYKHVIINDRFDRAYQLLRSIYLVHRAPTRGQADNPDALDRLAIQVALAEPTARARAQAMIDAEPKP